jgi:hypothetical protein
VDATTVEGAPAGQLAALPAATRFLTAAAAAAAGPLAEYTRIQDGASHTLKGMHVDIRV